MISPPWIIDNKIFSLSSLIGRGRSLFASRLALIIGLVSRYLIIYQLLTILQMAGRHPIEAKVWGNFSSNLGFQISTWRQSNRLEPRRKSIRSYIFPLHIPTEDHCVSTCEWNMKYLLSYLILTFDVTPSAVSVSASGFINCKIWQWMNES